MDFGGGKAPGIGGNVLVKAMDYTANAVMSDFGMTDLASARQGESMAPKLPPDQQRRADAMFNPAKRSEVFGGGGMMASMVNAMAAGAVANASLAPQKGEIDGIGAIHAARYKPNVHMLTDAKTPKIR